MLSLIVAYDENRTIGCRGNIPWHLPGDLKHFKKTTIGNPILMGRKTWESLGGALPDRDHYILTRSFKGVFNKLAPRVIQVNSFQWAIDLMRHNHPGKTGWVIGGAEIYKTALEEGWIDRIVATEVKGVHDGDAFFPKLADEWSKIPIESHELFDIVWYVKE